jgi:hypothetical protein
MAAPTLSRVATCACRQLQLACEGQPRRVSMCHCLDCQRRTGSILSIAVFYERDAVTVSQGASRTFTRDSASGKPVTFHFCERCGANVFWEPERMPHLIAVAVGAFGDPGFPQPEQSVWTKDKHVWLTLPDGMPVFEVNPPPRIPSER